MTDTDDTPTTRTHSYQELTDDGEDVSLRRQVAQALADAPATTAELAGRFEERSANAIRPRVNELIRMDCVERDGTRENPSGHAAYVHHLTPTGERYLAGEVDPDPAPPLVDLAADVVDAARAFCAGAVDADALKRAVKAHDGVKLRRDPEWSPEYVLDSDGGRQATADGGEVVEEVSYDEMDDGGDEIPEGLTREEYEAIQDDPVLEVSDVLEGRE